MSAPPTDIKAALSAFEAELSELGALGDDSTGDGTASALESGAGAGAGAGPGGAEQDPFRGLGVAVEPEPQLAVGRVAFASAPKLKDEKEAAQPLPRAAGAGAVAPVVAPSSSASSASSSSSSSSSSSAVVIAKPQIISSAPQLNQHPDVLPAPQLTEAQKQAAAVMALDAAAKHRAAIVAKASYASGSSAGGSASGSGSGAGSAGSHASASVSGSAGDGDDDGDEEGGGGGGGGGSGPIRSDKKKKFLRTAGGKVWEDNTLADWPENDFRIFCGDLGNEVNDQTLAKAFSKYASFHKAHVVREKHSQKSKGFGFVGFMDPHDCAAALREMNGKYVGNRPVKLRKSTHDKRDLKKVQKEAKGKRPGPYSRR